MAQSKFVRRGGSAAFLATLAGPGLAAHLPRITHAPDDGTGAAGAGDGNGDEAAAAAAAAAAAGGNDHGGAGGEHLAIGGADGAQPSLHKPEGVPDHLFGQNDQETIDKIWGAYKGARETLSKQGKVPEKADAYAPFEWGEKVKGAVAIADDDEMTTMFKDIAHKRGFTDDHMKAIPEFFDLAVEKGLIEPNHDTRGEMRKLAPEGFSGSDEAKEAKGAERVQAADRWIGQLSEQRGFTEEMKTELRLLTTTAAGVSVVESFIKAGMGGSVNAGGDGGHRAMTKADLDRRIADPRNDTMGEKYDPAFAKETDEAFKKFYG